MSCTDGHSSPWSNINYPFGYLLVNRYIAKTPIDRLPIQPYSFAYVWLYVAMTDDAERCNIDALILGLWGRYLSDAQLVGITPVDGDTFIGLVHGVRMWLREDKEFLAGHGDTLREMLWETSQGDVYDWWYAFHQHGLELGLPLFENDTLRSWSRFIRYWDQDRIMASTSHPVRPDEPSDLADWMLGIGVVGLLGYGLVSWFRQS